MHRYTVTTVTGPTVEPVTLQEAKVQCAIEADETHWDDDLSALITTAREFVEKRCNRSLCDQSLKLTLSQFPRNARGPVMIPRGPVRSITTVAYTDANGSPQTVSGVQLIGYEDAAIIPARGTSWPETQTENASAVQITYAAGDTNNLPKIAKRLVLLLVGHWFSNREAVGTVTNQLPFAVETLIRQLDMGDEFTEYGQQVT